MIAWYGMNMPNRISVNTRLAYGNFHRERTNPFIDPSIAEMTAAGIASRKVRPSGAARASHAVAQLPKPVFPSASVCQGQRAGHAHDVTALTSDGGLRLVTTST